MEIYRDHVKIDVDAEFINFQDIILVKKTKILTTGCVLSVDIVEVVIGLVAHCGEARLVGDVIECDDVPVEITNDKNHNVEFNMAN